MNTLTIDIETYSGTDIKQGVYKYTQDPDFTILLFGYAYNDDPIQVIDLTREALPKELVWDLQAPEILKTAFNAAFERVCLQEYVNRVQPLRGKSFPLPINQWQCTSVLAGVAGLPMNLDGASKALRLTQTKDAAGKALIKYFTMPCKPTKTNGMRTRNLPEHSTEKWQQFIEYCRQDVEVERAIRKQLSYVHISQEEHTLYHLDQQINDNGVLIDSDFVNKAIAIDEEFKACLAAEAIELSGIENPNSRNQILEWLQAEGEDATTLRKADIPELIANSDNPDVKRLLTLRQELSKTSTSKYLMMRSAAGYDDRLRGLFQFYGASRTGRWAGRLVQPQNLPRIHFTPDTLDLARRTVAQGDTDTLEMVFGDVTDTLSQLIRTAFIAPKGSRFIVSDFSAIEARVIAWLAGEQDSLAIFASHGLIYEATAAAMYKVPIESIVWIDAEGKKHKGENYHLRANGKVAVLSCGYQGGPSALIRMGALEGGIKEEELQPIVDKWRLARAPIVKFWYDCGKAAIRAVKHGTKVSIQHGMSFHYRDNTLWITLPSGRQLAYYEPTLKESNFGGEALCYKGMDQVRKIWGNQDTYGGKIVENCLGENTLVLTLKGYICIKDITSQDKVWDGECWVSHKGLINKGEQPTIKVDGVYLTAEHKILTTNGWKDASQSEGHFGAKVKLPNGYPFCRLGRKKIYMGGKLRLWPTDTNGRFRVQKRGAKILRLQEVQTDKRKSKDSRYVDASGLFCMAFDDRQMLTFDASSVEELRSKGDKSLRPLGRSICCFLAGHGGGVRERSSQGQNDTRENRREWELRAKQLPMGDTQRASEQQEGQCLDKHSLGQVNSSASVRGFGYKRHYAIIPDTEKLARTIFVHQAGRNQQVYDLLDCGELNRFTILTTQGPLIVHNCTQAVARDCMAHAMTRLHAAGYKIVMHVHDEVVLEMPYGQGSEAEVAEIMSQGAPWAAGLPLVADGYETEYYKKD